MRSFVAVVAGLVIMAMAALVSLRVVATAADVATGEEPDATGWTLGARIVLLVLGLATGVLGGFVTGRVKRGKAWRNAMVLALIVFAICGIIMAMAWGQEPLWYALIRQAGIPATILCGGYWAREVTKAHRKEEGPTLS